MPHKIEEIWIRGALFQMLCYIKKMKNYDFGLPITSSNFSFIFVNLICFDHRISV
jgi:hypothetical protein